MKRRLFFFLFLLCCSCTVHAQRKHAFNPKPLGNIIANKIWYRKISFVTPDALSSKKVFVVNLQLDTIGDTTALAIKTSNAVLAICDTLYLHYGLLPITFDFAAGSEKWAHTFSERQVSIAKQGIRMVLGMCYDLNHTDSVRWTLNRYFTYDARSAPAGSAHIVAMETIRAEKSLPNERSYVDGFYYAAGTEDCCIVLHTSNKKRVTVFVHAPSYMQLSDVRLN